MEIKYIFISLIMCLSGAALAQDGAVYGTFGDRRIINTQSIETLPARKLDFRIAHRFGDLAGDAGGWPTFYGLENAADVLIGFEYGVTDNLTIGLGRTKGAGPLKQLINIFVKQKVLAQGYNNMPVSLAVVGMTSASTMQKSETEGVLHFFDSPLHRWNYHLGVHAARKFGERYSAQVSTTWTYRNIVPANDENTIISLGLAGRAQLTKAIGIILDTSYPMSSLRTRDNGFYPVLGLGVEFTTGGGHSFQMNFTNVEGLSETDYIPYSQSNIGEGEFRLGFTISRLFSL